MNVTTGTVKITPTIAWATSMLAWGMLNFGDGYNNSGADLWAKGKETLRWNTDYLLKTVKDDPVSSALSTKPEFYIVYQVCWLQPTYTAYAWRHCRQMLHVVRFAYCSMCMGGCSTCVVTFSFIYHEFSLFNTAGNICSCK